MKKVVAGCIEEKDTLTSNVSKNSVTYKKYAYYFIFLRETSMYFVRYKTITQDNY